MHFPIFSIHCKIFSGMDMGAKWKEKAFHLYGDVNAAVETDLSH